MHFDVYIDDETGRRLTDVAQRSGETRNALIRRVAQEWLLRRSEPQRPQEIMDIAGIPDIEPFEAGRDQLVPPAIDPLA